ncbi:MAG: PfkB family carbohydrate kinase [Puniceicoccales bacterium]|jgi:D-beta-D-heptose 7-phosphate kinase/D-beta-D-heptose 1-phosphate adenosyltransferase|nr:PfkB family carbohydrate kinase [Puniceicoccales bacterium]
MKDLLAKIVGLKVLVIGDIMLDHYVIGDTVRISPEAPVPVVAVENDKYALGAAANVALNVAQLGCHTEVVGKIGMDDMGGLIKNLFRENKIHFDPKFESATIDTITKSRVVVRGQQLCRIDRENRKLNYEIADANLINEICEKIQSVNAVIFSDYAKGTISNLNISKFVDAANVKDIFTAMDPKPINKLNFSGISLITPNKMESVQLAGLEIEPHDEPPWKKICDIIDDKYLPKNLVITLGVDGMLVQSMDRQILRIPTYAKEVFDVSGAGDTSISCLTAALTVGASLIQAAKFANIAAGIVVAKHGTAAISASELLGSENGQL